MVERLFEPVYVVVYQLLEGLKVVEHVDAPAPVQEGGLQHPGVEVRAQGRGHHRPAVKQPMRTFLSPWVQHFHLFDEQSIFSASALGVVVVEKTSEKTNCQAHELVVQVNYKGGGGNLEGIDLVGFAKPSQVSHKILLI